MLKTIKRSDRHNMYDLRVRMMVDAIIKEHNTLDEFKQQFFERIQLIPQMSAYAPAFCYVLLRKEFYMQVWHRNVSGKKDRLLFDVFSVTDFPFTYDESCSSQS